MEMAIDAFMEFVSQIEVFADILGIVHKMRSAKTENVFKGKNLAEMVRNVMVDAVRKDSVFQGKNHADIIGNVMVGAVRKDIVSEGEISALLKAIVEEMSAAKTENVFQMTSIAHMIMNVVSLNGAEAADV